MTIQQMAVASGRAVAQLTTFNPTSTGGAVASVMFNTNGSVDVVQDGVTTTYTNYWLLPNPNTPEAALYEIRRTQTSGTIGVTYTGTMTSTTWYPLTSQRGVSVVAGGSARSNVSTWDIRRLSDTGTVVATVSLTVTSNP